MTDTSKLDNLNASYDELLLELQKDEDSHSVKKSPLVFEPQNKLLSESETPDFLKDYEEQHKKKGFFAWLFGRKKRDDGLNLNLDIPDTGVSKEQQEREIAAAQNKERSLMYVEKDFLDEEFSHAEEPRESDFIKKQEIPVKTEISKPIITKNPSVQNVSKESQKSSDFDVLLNEIRKNINDTAEKKLKNEQGISEQKMFIKPAEGFLSKSSNALKSTDAKVSNIYDKLSLVEKEYLTEDSKLKTDEEKIATMQKNLQSLNSQISSMSKDISSFKTIVQETISKNTTNPVEIAQLNSGSKIEQDDIRKLREEENSIVQDKNKIRQDLDAQSIKINEISSQITNLTQVISTCVKQNQFEKLKEMLVQIDAYVDTFDDRERELEKKYQETKEIMSKLELLEVQLNKQSSDYDVIATDLKSKVNFVYKYLQQVQNNMYVLSKSIELKKEEREIFDQNN